MNFRPGDEVAINGVDADVYKIVRPESVTSCPLGCYSSDVRYVGGINRVFIIIDFTNAVDFWGK